MADRILVYGVTGSGKTTLAAQISERTGLPWHCVDDLTWEPGWTAVPHDEQRGRIEQICSGDRWVLDSAYGHWIDVPMARVDLIVALDFARWISLSRLLRRSIRRTVRREPACNGNIETLWKLVGHDSIVVWHFRSFTRKRERIREWEASPSAPSVLRLTSPREAAAWLAGLGGAPAEPQPHDSGASLEQLAPGQPGC